MSNSPARTWVTNPVRAGLLGWLFRYGLFALFLASLGLLAGGRALYRHLDETLPDVGEVAAYETAAPGVSQIHDRDGAVLATLARERRTYASIDEIPATLTDAFIAAEDRRFFQHHGVDLRGIGRALVANLRSGTISQGGSTITQQVAKSFLGHEQTIERKLREAILAVHLEAGLDKRQILEIYLNKIFLGAGAYGVRAAAQRYFGRELDELSVAQSALLAGLARAPSRDNPRRSMERARRRRDVILRKMAAQNIIDEATLAAALDEAISLAPSEWDPFRWRLPYFSEHARLAVIDALGDDAAFDRGLRVETFADAVASHHAREAMLTELGALDRRQGWRGAVAQLSRASDRETFLARTSARYGLAPLHEEGRWYLALVEEVRTNDAYLRVGATRARMTIVTTTWAAPFDARTGVNNNKIESMIEALEPGDVVWVRGRFRTLQSGARSLRTGDEGLPLVELRQVPRVEASMLSSNTVDGRVDVMEGGVDYDRSQFNRATLACRQPGSVFKAIYYALALDRGRYEIDSILQHVAWVPEPGESWNPRDIEKTPDGRLLLRTAFIKSLNTPSIRLFLELGAGNVVEWARRLGIRSELIADKALSLGASCVKMTELSRAFGVFATNGREHRLRAYARVVDKHGATLLDDRPSTSSGLNVAGRVRALMHETSLGTPQLIDARTAFLTTSMMRDVVRVGTGVRANQIGAPAAGKSGTASKGDYTTDAWFVGFTSRRLTSAWVGDDRYIRSLGDHEASYTTATPMWTRFMRRRSSGLRHTELPAREPPGIATRTVDATMGGPPIPGLPSAKIHFATAWTRVRDPLGFPGP